jgi:hypothetical protein
MKLPFWEAVGHLCHSQLVGWTRLMAGLSCLAIINFAKTAIDVEICGSTWKIGVRQCFSRNRRPSDTIAFVGISTISTHKTLDSR